MCTQDMNCLIRKAMADGLSKVTANMSKETFQDYFYEEMVDLISDEDIIVKMVALEWATGLMDKKLDKD